MEKASVHALGGAPGPGEASGSLEGGLYKGAEDRSRAEEGKIVQSSPVLIIGCPRSGTSVLSWAIAHHADFWTSAESDFIIHLFRDGQLISTYNDAYYGPDIEAGSFDRPWDRLNRLGKNILLRILGHRRPKDPPRSRIQASRQRFEDHQARYRDYLRRTGSGFLMGLFGEGRLRKAYKKAVERPDGGWLQKHQMDFDEFAQHLGTGLDLLFRSRSGGKRWVDATPGHTLMAEDLACLFPKARFIHILRDGRAVVNSMIHSGFGKLGFNSDVEKALPWAEDFRVAAETWVHYVTLGREFVEACPQRCIEVRQEDLILEPEKLFRAVFAFLGVEHCPKSVEFVQRKRVNSSFDPGPRSGSDIHNRSKESLLKIPWQEWTEAMRADFKEIAGSTMARMGYPL